MGSSGAPLEREDLLSPAGLAGLPDAQDGGPGGLAGYDDLADGDLAGPELEPRRLHLPLALVEEAEHLPNVGAVSLGSPVLAHKLHLLFINADGQNVEASL